MNTIQTTKTILRIYALASQLEEEVDSLDPAIAHLVADELEARASEFSQHTDRRRAAAEIEIPLVIQRAIQTLQPGGGE